MNIFKKFIRLFSLERRLTDGLNVQLTDAGMSLGGELARFESVVQSYSQVNTKLKAEFNERMSKFEVLFAEEMEAKEKARDALVKAKMDDHRHSLKV